MRRCEVQLRQEAGGVLGHVAERVAGRPLAPAKQLEERGRASRDVRGLADVAVVEADDVEAPAGQLAAEVVRPRDHLRGQAHHQEGGRVGGIAERLVAELDLGAHPAELLRHSGPI